LYCLVSIMIISASVPNLKVRQIRSLSSVSTWHEQKTSQRWCQVKYEQRSPRHRRDWTETGLDYSTRLEVTRLTVLMGNHSKYAFTAFAFL
jgi:hypothetical protein